MSLPWPSAVVGVWLTRCLAWGVRQVMIFAGYPEDMERFIKANEGLYRRLPYTFTFPGTP
jgi:hypothetical protein